MDNQILILLSGLVLFSYAFDLFSRRTRVPSVLLLMGLGYALQLLTNYFGIVIPFLEQLLPTLGTIGLIMIVFEGALELHFSKSRSANVRKSFFSAFFNLMGATAAISAIIHYYSGSSYYDSILNAIPFAVVSSAIAIPSVNVLDPTKKAFIVYESSFSDILGIVLFNFMLVNREVEARSFLVLGFDLIITLVIAAIFSVLILMLMGRIKHHVKFFLIISMLIMIYAIAKMFHLSSLIIVLAFGLFLKNAHQMPFTKFRERLLYGHYQQDFEQLYNLSAESAFLIRTFFFVIFGFLINTQLLTDVATLEYGGLFILFVFVFRAVFMIVTTRRLPMPETLINPRGLISILLFYSIPPQHLLPMVNEGLLFIVILGTSLIMALGMLMTNMVKK